MRNFWKEYGGTAILFTVCVLLHLAVFSLYGLPAEAVAYPALLCAGILLGYALCKTSQRRKKHEELMHLKSLPDDLPEALRRFDGRDDRDYRELLETLWKARSEEVAAYRMQMEDSMDYYTAWVHQIKTPIASMRLRLEHEDSALSRGITEDLLRIEQYVGMVLTYLRLNSDSTDYVFRDCGLDGIVKGVIRKFAGQFIARGIRLEYSGTDARAVTDEKWLAFVLEQIFSNSLKYTQEGSVTVYFREPCTLYLRDTGIGIAPEDLPRIFEKGYTGENGRADKRASGLGLYLCKRICDNLGIRISVRSRLGVGTEICLDLEQSRDRHE